MKNFRPAIAGLAVPLVAVGAAFLVAGTSGASDAQLMRTAQGMCLANFAGAVFPDVCNGDDASMQWNRIPIDGGWTKLQNVATGACLATNAREALYVTACDPSNMTLSWSVPAAFPDNNFNWLNRWLIESVKESWCIGADVYHAFTLPCYQPGGPQAPTTSAPNGELLGPDGRPLPAG